MKKFLIALLSATFFAVPFVAFADDAASTDNSQAMTSQQSSANTNATNTPKSSTTTSSKKKSKCHCNCKNKKHRHFYLPTRRFVIIFLSLRRVFGVVRNKSDE